MFKNFQVSSGSSSLLDEGKGSTLHSSEVRFDSQSQSKNLRVAPVIVSTNQYSPYDKVEVREKASMFRNTEQVSQSKESIAGELSASSKSYCLPANT
mmetsp:Transcript_41099/g.30231  ORF Transcript_41099/g.30231 Transcript_41099/m.30231 type:complete len:97 (+) Transcript_41099:679-969(+)